MTVQVVFDAPLLVDATAYAGATWRDWPAVPPVTGNHNQDALGVVASAPLELALADRRLLVTTNPALARLGPRWSSDGQPILRAEEFVARVDAGRRAGDV